MRTLTEKQNQMIVIFALSGFFRKKEKQCFCFCPGLSSQKMLNETLTEEVKSIRTESFELENKLCHYY